MSTLIRAAEANDAHAIAQVHVSSWQSAYKGLLPDSFLNGLSVAQREENWQNAIVSSPTLIDVCESEGAIVGFVAYGRSRDEDAWTNQLGEIYAIYLKAGSWGKGYGNKLLDSVLKSLHGEGYKGAMLWVLNTNQQAIHFYERNGFVADGKVKNDELSKGVKVTELRYTQTFTVVL